MFRFLVIKEEKQIEMHLKDSSRATLRDKPENFCCDFPNDVMQNEEKESAQCFLVFSGEGFLTGKLKWPVAFVTSIHLGRVCYLGPGQLFL